MKSAGYFFAGIIIGCLIFQSLKHEAVAKPAFPRAHVPRTNDPVRDNSQIGMTYREWLIGCAMQGILSRVYGGGLSHKPDDVAKEAATYADAVVRQGTKE